MFHLSKGSSVFLNIVRAIFAQVVLIGHLLGFLGLQTRSRELNIPNMQSLAVTVFFLLSGFLTILSAESKKNLNVNIGRGGSKYFLSRTIRVYSVLIPALIAIVLIDFISIAFAPDSYSYYKSLNWGTLISNLFMLQNFPLFKGTALAFAPLGTGRPLWTLPLEWFLYILFGFFFYRTYEAIKNKAWKIACIVLICFCFLVPYEHFIFGSGNGLTFTWLVGMFVFVLLNKCKPFQISYKLWFFVALLLSFFRIYSVRVAWKLDYDPLFSVLLGVCLYCGILMTENTKWSASIRKGASFFANYSFSLYITHYSIVSLITQTLKSRCSTSTMGILMFIASNLFAILFAYLFENKLSRLLAQTLNKP